MYPSIGTATGTRVDGPAKHMMQCRVATNIIMQMLKDNKDSSGSSDPESYLKFGDKHAYAMAKDDLAMNCGTPLIKTATKIVNDFNRMHAYPLVTSVCDFDSDTQTWLKDLYKLATPSDFYKFLTMKIIPSTGNRGTQTHIDFCSMKSMQEYEVQNMSAEECTSFKNRLQNIPRFHVQGYCTVAGNAHPDVGDTMCTIMCGGVITVRNGPFAINCGDRLQWIFSFEEDQFSKTSSKDLQSGQRLFSAQDQSSQSKSIQLRKDWMNLQHGAMDTKRQKTDNKSRRVFLIKPYVPSAEMNDHYGDKIRIFGVATSGARPYDMVDIKLGVQSM